MKLSKMFSPNRIFFAIKVILVFGAVEATSYLFGHFEADTIAVSLIVVSVLLFLTGLFIVRRKDKNQKNGFAV